jgi:hypothetical protein
MEQFLTGGGHGRGITQLPAPGADAAPSILDELDEVDEFITPAPRADNDSDSDGGDGGDGGDDDTAALTAYMRQTISGGPTGGAQLPASFASPAAPGGTAAVPTDDYGDADADEDMLAGELSEDEALYERLGISPHTDAADTSECFLCDFAAGEYPAVKDTRLARFVEDVRRDCARNFKPRHYIALARRYETDIRAPANASLAPSARALPPFSASDIFQCTHFHRRPGSERIADESIHLFRAVQQTVRNNDLVVRNPRRRRRDGRFVKHVQKDQFKIILDASREIRQLLPYASEAVASAVHSDMDYAPGATWSLTRLSMQKRAAQRADASATRPAKRARRGY